MSEFIWQVFYRPARRLLDYVIGVTPEPEKVQEMVLKPNLKHKNSNMISIDDSQGEDSQPLKGEAGDSLEDSQDQKVFVPSQTLGHNPGYLILEPTEEKEEGSEGMQLISKQEIADPESCTLWQCLQSVNFW